MSLIFERININLVMGCPPDEATLSGMTQLSHSSFRKIDENDEIERNFLSTLALAINRKIPH